MTSFLDAIALDESTHRTASRKAIVLAKHRADKMFGTFIAAQGETALEYLEEDLKGVVQAACEETGHEDVDGVYAQILGDFAKSVHPADSTPKEASVHESRKPKMCKWHKDVVDISLAAEDARAGFDAMAQHWGGPRHCEGEGYEGEKCNFKPQMTTQAYWDTKSEKAEERKNQRAEQAEQDALEQTIPPEAVEVDEEITVEPSEAPVDEAPTTDAEVIDFPVQEAPEAVSEVPMSMAAKTADDTTGLGGPEPVINKERWTPQSVPALEGVDDADGPNPTKRKDIVEPIKAENADKLEEIGEQQTEHQELSEDTGPSPEKGVGTFPKGDQANPVTQSVAASIPNDVDKNPIIALAEGDYDGFLPQNVVQQAITASRRS